MTPSRQLIEREKLRLRGFDGPTSASPYSRSGTSSPTPVSTELRRLMLSLMPLKSIEATLRQRLGAEEPEGSVDESNLNHGAPLPGPSRNNNFNRHPPFDPFVRPASALSSASTSSSSVRSRVLGFRRHSVSSSNTSSAASSAPAPVDFSRHCSNCSASGSSGIGIGIGIGRGGVYGQEPRHVRRNSRIHSIVDSFAVKVRGSTGWKRRARLPEFPVCDEREISEENMDSTTKRYSRRNSFDQMSEQDKRDLLAARQIIEVFGEDIDRLWRHADVQDLLRRKNIRLENRPGLCVD